MGKLILRIRLVSLLVVLIVINLTIFNACRKDSIGKNPPKTINGVLDLNNWDLKKDGPIDLTAFWKWIRHLSFKSPDA